MLIRLMSHFAALTSVLHLGLSLEFFKSGAKRG